jgi:DHA1 family bicyclomycin/chloramphenicol resistance-like MFS transporter
MGEGAIRRAAALPTWHLGLALGVLSCLGPLSIDLYLPAFPTLVHDFGATPGDVQRTLSVFLLALAAAQIPFGSFGDRRGRKPALYVGLCVFVATSLACALSRSIDSLIALRFLQGCGICAGTAVSRAMIRDLRSGPEAARLMALTFLIIGVSPILAPLLGSYLLAFVSWRGLFVILGMAGLGGLLIVRFALHESLPQQRRRPRDVAAWRPYARLLANGSFLSAAMVAGLATTIPYAYVTAAPFVLSGRYSLDARTYSILLGIDSLCSIGMAQLSPLLMRRWGARTLLVRISIAGLSACAVALALVHADELGLLAFQGFSMLVFGVVGLLLTPAAVSALDAGSGGAGATAAALGTLTLAITAASSAAISLFPAFSVAPLLAVVGGSLGLALLISIRFKPEPRPLFSKRNYAE